MKACQFQTKLLSMCVNLLLFFAILHQRLCNESEVFGYEKLQKKKNQICCLLESLHICCSFFLSFYLEAKSFIAKYIDELSTWPFEKNGLVENAVITYLKFSFRFQLYLWREQECYAKRITTICCKTLGHDVLAVGLKLFKQIKFNLWRRQFLGLYQLIRKKNCFFTVCI